jgi:hypothetical protein
MKSIDCLPIAVGEFFAGNYQTNFVEIYSEFSVVVDSIDV